MNIAVRELQGDEAQAALKRTAMDVQIAGDRLKGDNLFYAAHGANESIAVLVQPKETSVWLITGGDFLERKNRAASVRQSFGL